MGAIADQFNQ